MTDKILVLTTAGSEEEARKIAHSLVERRLAACVNIVPRIHSVYRWQDKIESADEFLLIIKTAGSREQEVENAVRQLHSYALPEHVTLAVDTGTEKYLQWIAECVS